MLAYSAAVGGSFSRVNRPYQISEVRQTRQNTGLRDAFDLAQSVMVLAMWLMLVLEAGSVPVLVQAAVLLR